ncbi:DUF305 domain-containing protein [Amycolatopsis sp. H20-H5]|uniref:DUF305 domain-containing protein n=1 Tax=Amycolatopsis sp. H20-H5 TaxID=3046309 RepID=UPI002DB85A6A|nr:DUF305 domain-containing protein [Amycolatopsis sp. H20-H5]MEC3974398.1 DUF305 domain-containing protein [Amycolatopsis sp. H20-H5]
MKNALITCGIVLTSAALVAGCGSGDTTSGRQSSSAANTPSNAQQADHNQQDITFAQEMSQHHSQAIAMAKLAPTRSTNQKVTELAARIEKAQDPEIQQMQGWLTKWGAPGLRLFHVGHHGHHPGLSVIDVVAMGQPLARIVGVEVDL